MIELDFLIAFARSGDKHHIKILEIFEAYRRDLILSPYSLTELDPLVWSNSFKVEEPRRFFKLLNDTLEFYDVTIAKPSTIHVSKAYRLRADYRLTFFDSLHAATSIIEAIPLLSYDRSYERVKELNYMHPSKLA